ncbi:MAG: thioredoxin [Candidatus Diapherotrites archaeon]
MHGTLRNRRNARMVQVLTSQTFEEKILKEKKPMIVDFWAAWCGPCRMLAPVFEELEKEFEGKIGFGKINIDENTDIASQMSISSIPCMVFFSKGKEVGRMVGMMPKSELKKQISDHLKHA